MTFWRRSRSSLPSSSPRSASWESSPSALSFTRLPTSGTPGTYWTSQSSWLGESSLLSLNSIFQQDEITGLNFNPLNNELIRGLELSLFLYYTSSQYLPSPLHCTDICPHKNKIYLVRYFSYFSRPPSTAPLSWLQYNFLAYKLLGEGVKKFAISRKFCKDYFQLLVWTFFWDRPQALTYQRPSKIMITAISFS